MPLTIIELWKLTYASGIEVSKVRSLDVLYSVIFPSTMEVYKSQIYKATQVAKSKNWERRRRKEHFEKSPSLTSLLPPIKHHTPN